MTDKPERLWTDAETLTMMRACAARGVVTTDLLVLLDAERRRAIEFAWSLMIDMIGWKENWQYTIDYKDEAGVSRAAKFLHSLGLLERHPECGWYRKVT